MPANRPCARRSLPMRLRFLVPLGLSVPAAVAAFLAFRPATTDARPAAGVPAPDTHRLPFSRVVLFNSGVGYFLRAVSLAEVQRVRFLSPALEQQYRRARDTLAMSRDSQKKAVSLSFTGQGKRKVRVSYVTEAPIWKTSYRLVLGNGESKPYLQ